jgi:hypothetical protein
MNNLYPIAIMQGRPAPIVTPHDVAIELDGDACRFEIERSNQGLDGCLVCNLSRFAVELNLHRIVWSAVAGYDDSSQLS